METLSAYLTQDDQTPSGCPTRFTCNDSHLVSFDIGRIPSYLSITSSSLSCLGSILILVTYVLLKDMRTGAQTVITLLAVADFFTAFGYIMGSVNFLTHFQDGKGVTEPKDWKGCSVFNTMCEIQSFITTWSTMCSYCWTCILAFYFFLIMVYHNSHLASRFIPVYNIIAWIGPLLIVFPLLVFGKLGYAHYVASNWCYIKDTEYQKTLTQKPMTIVYLFLAGKLWEIISYAVVLVLYIWIRISLTKSKERITRRESNSESTTSPPKVKRIEGRLLAIPLLYIILRMWGTLQFFYSLAVAHTNQHGCIPKTVHTFFVVLGVLQAIGDGGQGWGNAILYIFLSPTIRQRLFGNPCEKCLVATESKLQKLLESDTDISRTNRRRRGRTSDVLSIVPSERTEDSSLNVAGAAKGYGIVQYNEDENGSTTTNETTTGTTIGKYDKQSQTAGASLGLSHSTKLQV